MVTPPSNYGYIPTSSNFLPNSPHFAYDQSSLKLIPTSAHHISNLNPASPIFVPQSLIRHHHLETHTPIVQSHVQRVQSDSRSSENETCVIVCDTNVYMHQIVDVWRIMESKSLKLCKIGIPWKVHNELDGLKKHKNWEIARNARLAAKHITFILKNLKQKVHCQGRLEYDQAKKLFEHENSDDSILQAILQMEESKVKHVFLHTYDTVLKNKALSIGLKLFEF